MVKYKVSLNVNGKPYDSRDVSNDKQLFETIGRFSVYYFLALDAIDYKDAYNFGWHGDEEDTLLAFTCDKLPDKVDGPHRHGMAPGLLARGHAWVDSSESEATITVERKFEL